MKSKDPDFKLPVGKDQFRCYRCDMPVAIDSGGYNQIEPGLEFKACNDCFKGKKNDSKSPSEEIKPESVPTDLQQAG